MQESYYIEIIPCKHISKKLQKPYTSYRQFDNDLDLFRNIFANYAFLKQKEININNKSVFAISKNSFQIISSMKDSVLDKNILSINMDSMEKVYTSLIKEHCLDDIKLINRFI